MEQQGGEGVGDMDMAPVVMAAGSRHRRRIVKLEESVVNKIAAGEVVQRPFNALKELLENSIDAGSTKVSVTVRDGGNTMIRVQDDGCGIHEGDLPLLCERHATSKLETFEDLRTVQTLGFRGEALCSVSYVAHLTVTTMREGDAHATRTVFRDSKIEDGPKPCAGLVGTTVTVEDLFYNMPIRRKALRSPSEELAKVIEVVGRYAVYHDGVGVSLKRHGNARPDVSTSASDTKQQKIRMVFGSQVGSNLLEFKASAVPDECDGEGMSFQAKGYASSANYNSGKRTVLVLFINGRLVECSPLKRCLETVYASVLAKGSRPFFYVELTIPHEQVDVNVHPTKKEVNFLHQDDLIERLREAVENAVFTSNDHRTYYKQTTLQVPGAHNSSILGSEDPAGARKRGRQEGDQKDPRGREATTRRDRAGGDYKLVRTDAHEKKLETFFFSQDKVDAAAVLGSSLAAGSAETAEEDSSGFKRNQEISLSQAAPSQRQGVSELRRRNAGSDSRGLTSVKELLDECTVDTHHELQQVLRSHVYVGMADERRALLQHKTKLYLVNVRTLSKDMAYQQVLTKFGRLPKLRLEPKLSCRDLLMLQMSREEEEGNWTDEDGCKREAVDLVVDLLVSKSEMLEDYFSLEIDEEGSLCALPMICTRELVPDQRKLPNFLLALGHDTEWESEKACFMGIADAIAELYSSEMTHVPSQRSGACVDEEVEALCLEEERAIQNVVFPLLRSSLRPSARRAMDATVVQVASLEKLYKIFERC